MTILVYTKDEALADELSATPPNGVKIEVGRLATLSASGHDSLALIITLSRDVAVGVFSAWLYDKIKGKGCRVEYRKKEVQQEVHIIQRVIEEERSED